MSLIEININNSFNKNENSSKAEDHVFDSDKKSTLNKDNIFVQTTAISIGSVTNNQQSNNTFLSKTKDKTLLREIIIATVSSIIGAVVGTIVTFFISIFKK